MRAMSLGNINTFLNVCKSLRSFDELKFVFAGTKYDYQEINEDRVMSININKTPFKGNICFYIETLNGDTAFIAMTTAMEMLRIEGMVAAGLKNMEGMIPALSTKVEKFIKAAANDMAAAYEDVKKTGVYNL